MNIANAIERALHLEAVVRIEKGRSTRIAAIWRDETEILVDSVNRLVQQKSVGKENSGRSSNSHWGGTRRNGNQYREQGSKDRARILTPGPNTRESKDNPRRENNYEKCRLCGQKSQWAKNCHNCFTCRSSAHTKRICPWIKRTKQTNIIDACSTDKTNCFNVKLLLNGKLVSGALDSGSSIVLISFDTYGTLGKPGSIKAINNKVLATNNSASKIVVSVDVKIQMKLISVELTHEFLITADNCLPCLLVWDFMIDRECFLYKGGELL